MKCSLCGEQLKVLENQQVEYCFVCGTVNGFDIKKLNLSDYDYKRTISLLNLYELGNSSDAYELSNNLIKRNSDNIMAYIIKGLLDIDFKLRSKFYKPFTVYEDELTQDVFNFIVANKNKLASLNVIASKFSIGFNRAQAILKTLEEGKFIERDIENNQTKILINPDEFAYRVKELQEENKYTSDTKGIRKLKLHIHLLKDIIYKKILFLEKKYNTKIIIKGVD